MDYQQKYLKYKSKYLDNKILKGGVNRNCPQCEQNVVVGDAGKRYKCCTVTHLYTCPTAKCGYWWEDFEERNNNHCFEVIRSSTRVTMKLCSECGLRTIDHS
jgi:predicted RNA-binding Zn-ribbon protein involved in translation (DUF1610 family)